MRICLPFVLFAVLAACEPYSAEDSAPPSSASVSPPTKGLPLGNLREVGFTELAEDPERLADEVIPDFIMMDSTLTTRLGAPLPFSERSLQEKDRIVRRVLLQEVHPAARWHFEQSVSLEMLKQALSDDATDPRLIAFYVDKLVQHKNPNADIIASGLARLNSHWSAGRIAAGAEAASDAALRYLSRECPDCRSAVAGNSSSPAGRFREEEITKGISDLAALREQVEQ